MLYHVLVNMVLIIGNIHLLGVHLALCLEARRIPYAFCAQYQTCDLIQRTRPLYAIGFSEIEAFLADHHQEIKTVVNLAPQDIPHHTQTDVMIQAIFRTTQKLWLWCAENNKDYVYASSQHTYDGTHNNHYKDGFTSALSLYPQSVLGWAHNTMDVWCAHALKAYSKKPPRTIAFKPFNIYGGYKSTPNASFVDETVTSLKSDRLVSMWPSEHPDFANGEYIRHFLHVSECAAILTELVSNTNIGSTLLNIAHPDGMTLIKATEVIAKSLRKKASYDYAPPPKKYGKVHPVERPGIQKLLSLGIKSPFLSLEEHLKKF